MRPLICGFVGRLYTSSRQWFFSERSFVLQASLQMQMIGILDA